MPDIDVVWEGEWKDLVRRLAEADVGTALGYETPEGSVRVNPPQGERVKVKAVFALVSGGEPAYAQAKLQSALHAA